jgi:hypothetical protein
MGEPTEEQKVAFTNAVEKLDRLVAESEAWRAQNGDQLAAKIARWKTVLKPTELPTPTREERGWENLKRAEIAFSDKYQEAIKVGWLAQDGKIVPPASTDTYEFLDAKFLELMNDIGRYGHGKYGADSFHARALLGDKSRGNLARTETEEILRHAHQHIADYENGILHDHFGTLDYQLAAAAFNLLMEFYFSQGE